jgi:hypothetical protein
MMDAVSASETSVSFYETARRNIPEDFHLCRGCQDNVADTLLMAAIHKNHFGHKSAFLNMNK